MDDAWTTPALAPVKTDERASYQHEREPSARITIPANLQPPPTAQPRQRPLDLPAVTPQPRRRLDPTPRDPRGDPATTQVAAVVLAVVALVGMDPGWSDPPPPRWRADRRNVTNDRRQHGRVSQVGGGDHCRQRQPTTVANEMELAPRLATIDGICAHMIPRVWRARSWCPRSPATSPGGRVRPAGPAPPGGVARTHRRWPTRSGGASRSTASRSQARGRAAAATAWKYGP
jgi:hypothetical protein